MRTNNTISFDELKANLSEELKPQNLANLFLIDKATQRNGQKIADLIAPFVEEIESNYNAFIHSNVIAKKIYETSPKGESAIRASIKAWILKIFSPISEEWINNRLRVGYIHYKTGVNSHLYTTGLAIIRDNMIKKLMEIYDHKMPAELNLSIERYINLEQYITLASYEACRRMESQVFAKNYEMLTKIVCHDLINPLSVAIHTVNSLQKTSTLSTPEFKEKTDRIAKQLDATMQITTNTRSYLNPNFRQKQSRSSWKDNVNIFLPLARELAGKKEIKIKFNNQIQLKETIPVNPFLFSYEILMNLITNAVKFSNPGSTIDIDATTTSTHMIVTVKDYGKGMSPMQLEQLARVNHSTTGTNGEDGSGFGLEIAYSAAQNSGGNISAESRQGENSQTTFTIEIPLIPTNHNTQSDQDPQLKIA